MFVIVFGLIKTLVLVIEVPRESATYNCPCENTGWGKYTPTNGMACPCALLIIIAKNNRTGNCFLLNWKGCHSFSAGDKGILGIKTCFPV